MILVVGAFSRVDASLNRKEITNIKHNAVNNYEEQGTEEERNRKRRSPQFFNNFDPIPIDEVADHFGISNGRQWGIT